MGKGRLEAFSDAVIAIIITIMVLELRPPHGNELNALLPLKYKFLSYLLSFIYLAIYWNNHHHLMQAVQKVNGKILWNNIHLLFWLSMVPFVTAWMGENDFTLWPVILYGIVMLMAGVAYFFLTRSLIIHHGKESFLAEAVGKDIKGIASLIIYMLGIGLSFVHPYIGFGLYVLVAAIWFIPDSRFEKKLKQKKE